MFISSCPVCSSGDAIRLVEINQVPVFCNQLWLTKAEALNVARGNVDLCLCNDCGHVFNRTFDPARLQYSQDYENSLHFSPLFQQYASQLASRLVERYGLYGKQIVEIGSGQGDFLAMLCEMGRNHGVGFDPSYASHGAAADDRSVTIIRDLYSEKYADYPADFICSRHVLEHIQQASEFIASLRRITANRNHIVVFFEVPNVLYTLHDLGIWDIIYEHPSYFSPPSLQTVFARNGFRVLRLEETFGAQFLTIEASPAQGVTLFDAELGLQLRAMRQAGASFAQHYREKVQFWQEALGQLKQEGRKAVVWGAGSKGVSFLNTLPAEEVIECVVDINPRKTGKFVAGSGQEIVSPEHLKTCRSDTVIVMNQNYRSEIESTLAKLGVEVDMRFA